MAPSFVLSFLVIVTIPLFLPCFCTCSGCIDRERQALLQFKAALGLNYSSDLSDTNLTSWEEGVDCCSTWDGIYCDTNTHHVVQIYLAGCGGFISESLCTLTSLEILGLSYSGLTGTIPDCLGKLSSLTELDLASNSLSGNIPLSFGNMSSLIKLYLSDNSLSGNIPLSFGNMSSLIQLDLSDNSLSGNIPLSFGNMSSLTSLDLSNNSLSGNIPLSFGNMSSLTSLDLSDNSLSGNIPLSFGNMSSLIQLDLSGNSLSGNIPLFFGNVFSLTWLRLSSNQLTGTIPPSLSNLSSLNTLDLSLNQLSGCIPESLGDLSSLLYLDLSYNKLNGTLPPTFSKLFLLKELNAEGNALSFRNSFPKLSSLESLSLTFNGGQIISEAFFQNLSKLTSMSFSDCVFNCSPAWIPLFQLKSLHMRSCKMDGPIPSSISTQFSLEQLELADSNLVGEIPTWLLNMSLVHINLTRNQLQGSLLLNTSARNDLKVLDVSYNDLNGQMTTTWPSGMHTLLLNDNSMTGTIPPTFQGGCALEILNLANNHFNGIIPPSIASCPQLS